MLTFEITMLHFEAYTEGKVKRLLQGDVYGKSSFLLPPQLTDKTFCTGLMLMLLIEIKLPL